MNKKLGIMDHINHLTLKKNQELQTQSSLVDSEETVSPTNLNCTLHQLNTGDIMKELCPMVIQVLSGFKLLFAMLQEFTLLKSKE